MKTVNKKNLIVRLVVFLCAVVVVACSQNLWANPKERLQEALESYSRAQGEGDLSARREGFRQAERLFSDLAGDGEASADLFANLGAAALQGGHLGQAVLSFRRALLVDPRHERALQNLHYARGLLPTWVPRPVEEEGEVGFFSWFRSFSVAESRAVGAVFFLITALGVAISVRFKSPLARNLSIIPALIWMVMIFQGLTGGAGTDHGVIVQEETMARAADSNNAPASFVHPLPAGTEVKVVESREGWTRIGLANGRSAWVRASALELVQGGRVVGNRGG